MTPNPFTSLPPPDSGSEQIVQAKPAALDEAVEKAYKVYEGLDIVYNFFQMGGLEKQILLPNQIDSLLQVIKSETEPEKLNSSTTGVYFTKLIQDSYNAGYNDFVLTTEDTHIESIGHKLSGSKKKRLKIRIDGNAGNWCWYKANSSEITICGNVGHLCGYKAKNTNFIAHNGRTYGELEYYVQTGERNTILLADSEGKIIRRRHL